MNQLPPEILSLIVAHCRTQTLYRLLLTNRALNALATQSLYSSISLSSSPDDLNEYHRILKSPSLAQHVRKITYTELSCDENCRKSLPTLSHFPNLERVVVDFKNYSYDTSLFWLLQHEDDDNERLATGFIAALCEALNTASPPAQRLKSLCVRNLSHVQHEPILNSPQTAALLSRIPELRLHLATPKYPYACSGADHRKPLSFFTGLQSTFLRPCAATLFSLTLTAAAPWAYIASPLFTHSAVRFPRLRKLELGDFDLGLKWVRDWILDHAATLEELVLDDCPIVCFRWHDGVLDSSSGSSVVAMPSLGPVPFHFNIVRWDEVFRRLEEGLPCVRRFVYGRGSTLTFDKGTGKVLERGIYQDRYTAFPGGGRRWVVWRTREGVKNCSFLWPHTEKGREELDRNAYGHFMAVVQRRREFHGGQA